MAVTNYFAEDEFGDVGDDDPGDEAVDVGAGGEAVVVEQEYPVEAADVVAEKPLLLLRGFIGKIVDEERRTGKNLQKIPN